MAPPEAKRRFTGTGMYQTKVAQEHQVGDDHELKTFRTSAAAPAAAPVLTSHHATPIYRTPKSEKDSWAQIAALKALRDAEDPNEDLLPYERAGCSPEKKALIPKLDETNNVAYKYLRSIGSTWEYKPEECHNKLKRRLYRRFDTFDKNTDNFMKLKEVYWWADRMRTVCDCCDYEIEEVRAALKVFFESCGISEEGLHRENWVEGNQACAEMDRERRKRGEASLVAVLGNAYFDVLDTNNDGLVTMPELRTMMNVFHVPEDAAFSFFRHADVDCNGVLHRDEMHNMFIKFWLSEYDPKYDGIYGYQY